MTRKKVKLAYITNDSSRGATYKKRKKGLMKKVRELSTLCGIEACAIMYSPYESQPEVWPSPRGVHRVLSAFKKMPEMEQSKKMVNLETFLRQRIAKVHEQLKKQCKDNREKEMTQVMFLNLIGNGLDDLNVMDLNDLGWLIDQNLKGINKRIDVLSKANQGVSTQEATMLKSSGEDFLAAERIVAEADQANMMDTVQRPQWIMDMIMNPEDNVEFSGDEINMLPLGDNNHNAGLWSNAFNFTWEK